MKEIAACFKKYFDFKGNSSRREYSCFLVLKVLIDFIFVCVSSFIDPICSFIFVLIELITIIPFVAVTVRRLHDIGKSGWLALLLLFPCVSMIFKLYLLFPKSVKAGCEGAQGDTDDKPTSCVVLLLIPIMALPIGFLVSVGNGAQEPVKEKVGQLQRTAMLRDMYVYLQTYQHEYGSFPSVQTTEKSGGVRDLYPLAKTGRIGGEVLNELLHPPGSQFDKFSEEPRPEEFDRNHIGWSYNSRARMGSEDPLMADQGVSSGYIDLQTRDRGIQPLSRKSVMVLLANGEVEYVPVRRRDGKLLTDKVKDWSVLKD